MFINKQLLNHHGWITLTPKKCCFHIVVYWWTILRWLQSCCCSLTNNLTLMSFSLLTNYSWMNNSKLDKLFISPNSPLPTPCDVLMLWAPNIQTCFHTLGIKQVVLPHFRLQRLHQPCVICWQTTLMLLNVPLKQMFVNK